MQETFRRFTELSWREKWLLMEAVGVLGLSALAVALVPFRYVGTAAARQTRRRIPKVGDGAAIVGRVRWAVEAASRRVPWRAKCFEQGLAAQYMLRRKGVPSVLFYGVTRDGDADLAAHVWVRAGNIDVIGCEIASRFALLATFPAQDSEEWRTATP